MKDGTDAADLRSSGATRAACGPARDAGPVSGLSAQAFSPKAGFVGAMCRNARGWVRPAASGSPEDDLSGADPWIGPRGPDRTAEHPRDSSRVVFRAAVGNGGFHPHVPGGGLRMVLSGVYPDGPVGNRETAFA